mmetsp:Transcript_29270/g.78595  ORF Transcript_29270/g.78595 Transcript_29270/m.78595 type:complete len:268 (-) Transcript_29270:152-955(-)
MITHRRPQRCLSVGQELIHLCLEPYLEGEAEIHRRDGLRAILIREIAHDGVGIPELEASARVDEEGQLCAPLVHALGQVACVLHHVDLHLARFGEESQQHANGPAGWRDIEEIELLRRRRLGLCGARSLRLDGRAICWISCRLRRRCRWRGPRLRGRGATGAWCIATRHAEPLPEHPVLAKDFEGLDVEVHGLLLGHGPKLGPCLMPRPRLRTIPETRAGKVARADGGLLAEHLDEDAVTGSRIIGQRRPLVDVLSRELEALRIGHL